MEVTHICLWLLHYALPWLFCGYILEFGRSVKTTIDNQHFLPEISCHSASCQIWFMLSEACAKLQFEACGQVLWLAMASQILWPTS